MEENQTAETSQQPEAEELDENGQPKKSEPETEYLYERPWMYDKQHDAFFNDARYSFCEASTKAGKTVGGIAWLFEKAYQGKLGQNFWWVAPVYPQAEIAYRRMRKAIMPSLVASARESDLQIVLTTGTIMKFKSGEKPDNLYGEDVYAAVVDEASRLREESWHALRSTVTATRGPIRFIGNVKGRKNWFYQLCRRAEAGEPDMEYHKIIAADAVAAGVLEQEEIEGAQRELPANVFQELYLAQPSDDGGNPFGMAAIAKCVGPMSSGRPRCWGWDLAKHVDWTVGIALDDEGKTCRFERFQKSWDDTIETIARLTGSTKALVDSTGVGDPVLEMLQKKPGTRFEGYNFNPSSKQKLMEGLAVKIQSSEVTFPDGPIRKELEEFEYEYTRTGVRYSAPEGFNDDCVVALALSCMHFLMAPPPMKRIPSAVMSRASIRMPGMGVRLGR